MNTSTKKLFLIVILAIGVMSVVVTYFVFTDKPVQNTLSDDQIRQEFNCNRGTQEARQTDYYCSHPDAYRAGKEVPQN